MANGKNYEHEELPYGTFQMKKGAIIEVWDGEGFYYYVRVKKDAFLYSTGEPGGKPPPTGGG